MAYDADDSDETSEVSPEDDLHERALREFDVIATAQQEERALALQDRRFVSIAGAQWEGAWGEQFANSIMVEVNKAAMGVEKIIADYRANRVIVNFRAVGKGADEDTADLLDGLFRADWYNSKGQQAADNAFEEAVQGGWGAWRLTHRYEDEYDPDDDAQRICIEIIPDADQSVFWDMDSRLYDKSDAKFCFVISAMSPDAFKATYGEERYTTWPDTLLRPFYDWYQPEVVRVAEYYAMEESEEWRLALSHRATGEEQKLWNKDLEPGELDEMLLEGWRLLRRRKVKRRRVAKTVMSGREVLRKKVYLAGGQIPVVPVFGKRWFIDNMERVRGHVRLAKDPQRIYNAQISKLVETSALAPIERPIFTPEQIAGHEQSWAEANINRAPYSLINPMIGADGSPLPAGPVASVNPPQLSPVLASLIDITRNDIAELTAADDGAEEIRSNVSAEAMDIAATRTDAKAFTYMDNFRQSMQRCGEIYLGMAREIYVEEGREVEVMSEDGTQGTATLYEPETDDQGRFSIKNDLEKGKYKVISDVTEATTTRRDKTVKTLVNVAQIAGVTDPELAMAAMSTALLNMDGEGITDLQDWLRQKLVRQGVVKPSEEEVRAMQEEAANQAPDPQSEALIALAEKERSTAALNLQKVQESAASAELKGAQTIKTLADAGQAGANADATRIAAEKDARTPVEPPRNLALEKATNG